MRQFNRDSMSPSDCVELYESINEFVDEKLDENVERSGYRSFDPSDVMLEVEEATGLSADDVIRFCEIGEFVARDREDRGIPQQDVDKWRHKREALGAMIDTLLARAIADGVIDDGSIVLDPTIEQLERLWDLS
jgi:hypothetical protein